MWISIWSCLPVAAFIAGFLLDTPAGSPIANLSDSVVPKSSAIWFLGGLGVLEPQPQHACHFPTDSTHRDRFDYALQEPPARHILCYQYRRDCCQNAFESGNQTWMESACGWHSVDCVDEDPIRNAVCDARYNVDDTPANFSKFLRDEYGRDPRMLESGCWPNSCTNHDRDYPLKKTKGGVFFCCETNECTPIDYFEGPNSTWSRTTTTLRTEVTPPKPSLYWLSLVIIVLPAILIIILVVKMRRKSRRCSSSEPVSSDSSDSNEKVLMVSSNGCNEKLNNLEVDVRFLDVLAQGRFGALYKLGRLHDVECILKTTACLYRAYWENERSIYKSLEPHEHENVQRYFRSGVWGEGETSFYYHVLEYHETGSLYHYLKEHTLTWDQVIRISTSLVSGVSQLHSSRFDLPVYKYPIAHRDLKSRNVLLKADLSAVVTDLDLALNLSPQLDMEKSMSELRADGTFRYMAPEILDLATTRPTALLAADIYSTALILWEIFSMWHRPGHDRPVHHQPYEAEGIISKGITRQSVHELVYVKRVRPKLEDNLKEVLPHLQQKDVEEYMTTIRDSWDCEPDSRLTAECIKHRLLLITDNLSKYH